MNVSYFFLSIDKKDPVACNVWLGQKRVAHELGHMRIYWKKLESKTNEIIL